MTFRTAAGVALCVIISSPTAWSASPQIKAIAPFGVRRGTAMEVTVTGDNLNGNPRLIAPFSCVQELALKPGAKPDASQCAIRVTAAADTAIGIYAVRVQTDDGLSNPLLMAVGQLPQLSEKEDNSTFESAQALPETPLVVEGQVADNDVDFFRFRGKKGERIVIDAQCARIGSGVDPSIRLTGAGATRTFVASADDSPGLLTDARLVTTLPTDGEYVVELSDSRYQGGGRPIYRLLIGSVPIAEEIFPLGGRAGDTLGVELRGGTLPGERVAGTTVKAMASTELFAARISSAMLDLPTSGRGLDLESLGPLAVSRFLEVKESSDGSVAEIRALAPVVFNGRIDPPGDEDRFKIAVTPGSQLKIVVHAADLGSSLDAVLQVIGAANTALANADDRTVALPVAAGQPAQSLVYPDPTLEMTVPGGVTEVTVAIGDLEKRGGLGFPYRIVVEPKVADFELVTDAAEVSVPCGGAAALGVTIRRLGYTGAIALGASQLPPGLSVRPSFINAGQTVGVLTLEATTDAKFTAVPIELTAQGTGADGVFVRHAKKEITFALQSKLPTNELVQDGIFTAPAMPLPVTLRTPVSAIEIAPGGTVSIPVTLNRQKDADGALAISTLPLPPGLTVPAATIADKKNEGSVAVSASEELPLGKVSLGLLAKGKFAVGERSMAAPGITFEVVQPASLEVRTAKLELKPGVTTELKGKVQRRGGYAGAIGVKITGLPAGVQADVVSLPAATSDFSFKVTAAPKTAAATVTAQVVLALQVNKKDYPIPSVPVAISVLAPSAK